MIPRGLLTAEAKVWSSGDKLSVPKDDAEPLPAGVAQPLEMDLTLRGFATEMESAAEAVAAAVLVVAEMTSDVARCGVFGRKLRFRKTVWGLFEVKPTRNLPFSPEKNGMKLAIFGVRH